jgi:hypothetical protein
MIGRQLGLVEMAKVIAVGIGHHPQQQPSTDIPPNVRLVSWREYA